MFLIAPIHHHFEMKAWSETKIMVRFWIVCAIFCASGFALFYRDFLQFVLPRDDERRARRQARPRRRARALRAWRRRRRSSARARSSSAFDRDEALDVGRLRELGVEVHLGREEETLLQGIDLVVKSPGVPGETRSSRAPRARGIPVWSEIELGARLLANPILGVTGTNGKTTTSELLGAVFQAAGTPVEVAGNVGRPLTSLVGA